MGIAHGHRSHSSCALPLAAAAARGAHTSLSPGFESAGNDRCSRLPTWDDQILAASCPQCAAGASRKGKSMNSSEFVKALLSQDAALDAAGSCEHRQTLLSRLAHAEQRERHARFITIAAAATVFAVFSVM